MTARRRPVAVDFLYAHVLGWTVAIRGGRVWLHPTGQSDGDLTPRAARALAAALDAAADRADRGRSR